MSDSEHSSQEGGSSQSGGGAPPTEVIQELFDRIAPHYDLMNDIMSWRIHRSWKEQLLQLLDGHGGKLLLDVAGGSGDIACGFVQRRAGRQAMVCDISPKMVARGKARAIDRGLLGKIDWVVGDAQQLPVGSRLVELYTIGFGLRNVRALDQALSEAYRVLQPGGMFACLEFSHPVIPAVAELYDWYSFAVLPRLGRWVAGDELAYRYLVESIRQFPDQDQLAERIEQAGFERVGYRNLSCGIAAIHRAFRL